MKIDQITVTLKQLVILMHVGEKERKFAEMWANYKRVLGVHVGKGSFWHLIRTGCEARGWITSTVHFPDRQRRRFGPRAYWRKYTLTLEGHAMLQRARDLLDVKVDLVESKSVPMESKNRGRHHRKKVA